MGAERVGGRKKVVKKAPKKVAKKKAKKKNSKRKTSAKKKIRRKAGGEPGPAGGTPHSTDTAVVSAESTEARAILEDLARGGYCLWVGAGLGKHLGAHAGVPVPLWGELVSAMEEDAGLRWEGGGEELSLPQRLNGVVWKLKRQEFQRGLRMRCAVPTADAVYTLLQQWVDDKEVPSVIDDVTLVGALANSVVNFNVETISSRLLAASGPFHLRVFHPPLPGSSGITRNSSRSLERSKVEVSRDVLHPHGAIDISGRCVFTEQEYSSMDGTLALELAVHRGFRDHVLIMGMSLGDEYLRRQLARFRGQLRRVVWCVSGSEDPRLLDWACAHRVTCVRFDPVGTMWSLFQGVRHRPKRASSSEYRKNRLHRSARSLSKDVSKIAELKCDISTCAELARAEAPDGSGTESRFRLGARWIQSSDFGEDPQRAGKLEARDAKAARRLKRQLSQLKGR